MFGAHQARQNTSQVVENGVRSKTQIRQAVIVSEKSLGRFFQFSLTSSSATTAAIRSKSRVAENGSAVAVSPNSGAPVLLHPFTNIIAILRVSYRCEMGCSSKGNGRGCSRRVLLLYQGFWHVVTCMPTRK